jgi:hypothetical protein
MRNVVFAALTTVAVLTGCNGAAGVGVGAGAGAAANPDMKALYTVGKKWEYALTSNAGGQNTSDTQTWEVTEVKDNKATLKITTKAGSASSIIDLAETNPYAKLGQTTQLPEGTKVNVGASTTENVTVPAGTYACLKTTSTMDMTQQGMAMTNTSDTWVNAGVGLVKTVSSAKIQMPAGMPSMPTMPGMGDIKTTMELKSFTP